MDTKDLPEEIWGKIFLLAKLPMKILGQCRSECRCWNSLVGSQDFIDDYNETVAGKTDLVLVKSEMTWNQLGGVVRFRPETNEINATLRLPGEENESRFCIIGSCKGLVCVELEFVRDRSERLLGKWVDVLSRSERLALWNPSIGKFKRIPPCPNQRKSGDSETAMGFGYGERDYKVVRITEHRSDCWRTYSADIYSLRLDSWSRIADLPPLNGFFPLNFQNDLGTHSNGAVYWLYWLGNEPDRYVLCFDIGSETFKRWLLKDSIPLRISTIDVSIGLFKTSLSLFHMREEGGFIHCEIWGKVEGQDNDWEYIQHLMHPVPFKIAWPLSGTTDHRFHVLLKNIYLLDHQLVLYDLMSKNFDDSNIEFQCSRDNFVGAYEESLTLLK